MRESRWRRTRPEETSIGAQPAWRAGGAFGGEAGATGLDQQAGGDQIADPRDSEKAEAGGRIRTAISARSPLIGPGDVADSAGSSRQIRTCTPDRGDRGAGRGCA
jgi:hypothetical protein